MYYFISAKNCITFISLFELIVFNTVIERKIGPMPRQTRTITVMFIMVEFQEIQWGVCGNRCGKEWSKQEQKTNDEFTARLFGKSRAV